MKKKLKETIHRQAVKEQYLFLDVALLMEMNWDIYCDFIIVADIEKEKQIQRVILRDNVSRQDVEKIIALQTENEIKKKSADFVVNTGYNRGIIKVNLLKIMEAIR